MGRSSSVSSISELGGLEVEAELIEELNKKEVDKKVVKRVELLLLLYKFKELEPIPPLPGINVIEVVEFNLVNLEPPNSLEYIPNSLNYIEVVPATRKRGKTATKGELPIAKRGKRTR